LRLTRKIAPERALCVREVIRVRKLSLSGGARLGGAVVKRGLATFFCALVVVVAAISAGSASAVGASTSSHRYIVVLRSGTVDPGAVAAEHGRRYGLTHSFVYRHTLNGYAASVPDAALDHLRNDPAVAYVAPDNELHAAAVTSQQVVPTGIRRVYADRSSAR